jgi:hypothetical protein
MPHPALPQMITPGMSSAVKKQIDFIPVEWLVIVDPGTAQEFQHALPGLIPRARAYGAT